MVDGSPPELGYGRLRSRHDDVRFWENPGAGECGRSDTAPCEPSHAPHPVDQRQDHLEHERLPHISHASPNNRLSDKRHGQPHDGKWKYRSIRDESPFIDAAGLRDGWGRGPVLDAEFQHYDVVQRTCDHTFWTASHPWRRAYRGSRLVWEMKSGDEQLVGMIA